MASEITAGLPLALALMFVRGTTVPPCSASSLRSHGYYSPISSATATIAFLSTWTILEISDSLTVNGGLIAM